MGLLIWGDRKLFDRNDRGVRLALENPILKGKSVTARGVYSVILGAETSVLKLTIDRVAYELAEHQSRWKCPALPTILGLHGVVGAIDIGLPLFLFEMESLSKLVAGTTARKRCLSIANKLRADLTKGESPPDRLRQVSTSKPLDEVSQALSLLADFFDARWPTAGLDLHGANFMLRQSTGEAVITDPFMDLETRSKVLEAFKLTQPNGTEII